MYTTFPFDGQVHVVDEVAALRQPTGLKRTNSDVVVAAEIELKVNERQE